MSEEVTTRFKAEIVPAPEHVAWIGSLPCCIPACRSTPIHRHHALTKGAHGDLPEHLVPLCWRHHARVHSEGRLTFQRRCGVDLVAIAERLAAFSRAAGRLP